MRKSISKAELGLACLLCVIAVVIISAAWIGDSSRGYAGLQHGYGESSSKAKYLLGCIIDVVEAHGRHPKSKAELVDWMKDDICSHCAFVDCFVDGFGTAFEISLVVAEPGEHLVVLRSAGLNKEFDDSDRTWEVNISNVDWSFPNNAAHGQEHRDERRDAAAM